MIPLFPSSADESPTSIQTLTCYLLLFGDTVQSMPERSSKKRPADINALAKSITDDATDPQPEPELTPEQVAARLLGSKGGKVGGKARAEKLTAERRAEIARTAAAARWGKR